MVLEICIHDVLYMCICVYMCMCVCVYLNICTRVCIYVCCTHAYGKPYVSMWNINNFKTYDNNVLVSNNIMQIVQISYQGSVKGSKCSHDVDTII